VGHSLSFTPRIYAWCCARRRSITFSLSVVCLLNSAATLQSREEPFTYRLTGALKVSPPCSCPHSQTLTSFSASPSLRSPQASRPPGLSFSSPPPPPRKWVALPPSREPLLPNLQHIPASQSSRIKRRTGRAVFFLVTHCPKTSSSKRVPASFPCLPLQCNLCNPPLSPTSRARRVRFRTPFRSSARRYACTAGL